MGVIEQPGESPEAPLGWREYDGWGVDGKGEVYHSLYGEWWPAADGWTELTINLNCFRENRGVGEGGLGAYGHLRECVDLLWNSGAKKMVEWNPWLEQLLEQACEWNYLAVAGCSSSSKSFGGAIFAIINFLSDPEHTLCLVTSTSVSAARKRIWKSVIQLWQGLPKDVKAWAKVKGSVNMIHYTPADGSVAHDGASISLVAAEPKQEASAVAKLVGLKNDRVVLIADELCELSPAVLASVDNLDSGQDFWMLALSNPKDQNDPFGQFSEPEHGWNSVDEGDFEWLTKYGKAIRFDCLQSVNYLEQERVYSYMLPYEKIEKARKRLGENSARFFRFFRGFHPIQGAEDVLYSEVDFRAYLRKEIVWGKKPPVKVAGMDPSFSSGGDRTILLIGLCGEDADGVMCLQYEKIYVVKENAADKLVPRTDQVCGQVKKILDNEGIEYKHFGVDNTGAKPFADRLSQILSRDIIRVEFGGKASDRPVTANDRTPSWKKFVNRVSELWGVGVEFLRGGQFAGLEKDPELLAEMKARRYKDVKGGDGERVEVERKRDMKKRSGRSPDCFVAGTMVATDVGERPIETIREGDLVMTPFGYSPVLMVHVSESEDIWTMTATNGRALTGKGTHKIFIPGEGWKRIDALSIGMYLESIHNQPKWKLLNLLFTRAVNIGFKALADITRTGRTERQKRRDYFTESCGLSATGLFLTACASITKMAIGRIMRSKIWKSCQNQTTPSSISQPSVRIAEQECWPGLKRPALLPPSGISLQWDGNGTGGTVITHGLSGRISTEYVSCAESQQNRKHLNTFFVASSAGTKIIAKPLWKIASVSFAAARSVFSNTLQRKLAVASVERGSRRESKKVYNLTLLEDNAYYANGFLVANCADAWMITAEVCRQRLNFRSVERGKTILPKKDFHEKMRRIDIVTLSQSVPDWESPAA